MAELVQAVVLIMALVAILGFILGGGRSDRAGWKDPISALGRPDGTFATSALGLLAAAQLMDWASMTSGQSPVTGFAIGLLLAVLIDFRITNVALNGLGVLAALSVAFRYVVAGEGVDVYETTIFRVALVLLITFTFIAGAMVGVMFLGRSARTFAFGHGRGLAFFGLVDVFVFLASPGGAQMLGLSPDRFYAYLGAAAVSSFLLGISAGQFTLIISSVMVGLVNLALPLTGLISDAAALPITSYFVAACVGYAIIRGLRGRLTRRSLL